MVRHQVEDISVDGVEVFVSIETVGEPEGLAEKIHLHAHDAAARALQAVQEGKLPEDCDGLQIRVDWEGVIAGEYGGVGD